jgi:hypothetical protein
MSHGPKNTGRTRKIVVRVPRTTRFCISCRKITQWEYVLIIGHSRCLECGSYYSRPAIESDSGWEKWKGRIAFEQRERRRFAERGYTNEHR